jgi:hypothetical protein
MGSGKCMNLLQASKPTFLIYYEPLRKLKNLQKCILDTKV